jgi:hypothetical protein
VAELVLSLCNRFHRDQEYILLEANPVPALHAEVSMHPDQIPSFTFASLRISSTTSCGVGR